MANYRPEQIPNPYQTKGKSGIILRIAYRTIEYPPTNFKKRLCNSIKFDLLGMSLKPSVQK